MNNTNCTESMDEIRRGFYQTLDNTDYIQLIEGMKEYIIHLESIKQLYLDKGEDADWVNKRFGFFIDNENNKITQCTHLQAYKERRAKRTKQQLSTVTNPE